MQTGDILFENDVVSVASVRRDTEMNGMSLVSFTGIGHKLNGLDVQKPEFFRTGAGYDNVIFIMDKTRSWGNAIDFEQLGKILEPVFNGVSAHALGNSMGGFLALLAPKFLPIERSVALVPQYSVNPSIVPWEDRWTEYRDEITEWRFPSLDGQLVDGCQYLVMSGGRKKDTKHLDMLPDAPNLKTFIFDSFNHHVAANLKQLGLLEDCISRCFRDEMTQEFANFAAQKRKEAANA